MFGGELCAPWSPERVALGTLCLRQAEADRERALRGAKAMGVVDLGRL